MKLFAPERERSPSGFPMYPADRPRYAVPAPTIALHEGSLSIQVMLSSPAGGFRWFSTGHLPPQGVADFIEDWMEDPERVMASLGWQPRQAISQKQLASLDALEIDL